MKAIRHDPSTVAARFDRAIAPRRFLAALKATVALLVVAGASGGATPSHAQATVGTETPAIELENAFWTCDHAGTVGHIDTVTALSCSSVTETLLQRRFDGDFGAMLAWWGQHKGARHLALATVGGTPRTEAAQAPVRDTRAQVTAPPDDPTAEHFSRFALNVLLVPLLDDAEPPRWTDVALGHICGRATRVEIDGKPLAPGAVIPATAFTVRWTMDRCKPLGGSSVELSGIVELLVFHEDVGLSAVVNADRLMVSSAAGTSRLEARFGGSMLLVAAHDRH